MVCSFRTEEVHHIGWGKKHSSISPTTWIWNPAWNPGRGVHVPWEGSLKHLQIEFDKLKTSRTTKKQSFFCPNQHSRTNYLKSFWSISSFRRASLAWRLKKKKNCFSIFNKKAWLLAQVVTASSVSHVWMADQMSRIWKSFHRNERELKCSRKRDRKKNWRATKIKKF